MDINGQAVGRDGSMITHFWVDYVPFFAKRWTKGTMITVNS